MKLIILCLLFVQQSAAQYEQNKRRVFETLVNLPILNNDWRCADLQDNYYPKWQWLINNTSIIDTENNTDVGMYLDRPVIIINQKLLTETDGFDIVLEHELFHAAFGGTNFLPGWMFFLGNNSADECCGASERIPRALILRRDIIDLFSLSTSTIITDSQLTQYIILQLSVGLHDGAKDLIKTTNLGNMVRLLNFENGYSF